MRTIVRSIAASLLVAVWLAFAFNYRLIGTENYVPDIGFFAHFLLFGILCPIVLPVLLILIRFTLGRTGIAVTEFAMGWAGTAIFFVLTMWSELANGPTFPNPVENTLSVGVSFLLLASGWVAYALLMSRGFKRVNWGL